MTRAPRPALSRQAIPPITERRFMSQIVELARLHGYMTYHTWMSVRSTPGFPDLVLLKPPRLIFLEIKTDSGKVTQAQQEWIDGLLEVTAVGAAVIRPKNWDDLVRFLT